MLPYLQRKPCVVGNWKMHGSRKMISAFLAEYAAGLLKKTDIFNEVEHVICPPLVYLPEIQNTISALKDAPITFKLGAQNVYYGASGAYTGEISPEMLVDIGCGYVIVGHSERRLLFCEDDTLIARKFKAAYNVGLIPILCVGETETERSAGKTLEVVSRQLEMVFEMTPIASLERALIAYEPVWAIGTGLTATPEQAEPVHIFIRHWIKDRDPIVAEKARILYGGSVKASNAKGLFAKPNIDGVLVGGASLMAEEFLNISQSAIESISWNK